jgi:cephalosporin-C deacetylase
MSLTDFDKYYTNLPALDKSANFDAFWQTAISQIKKVNIDLSIDKTNQSRINPFKAFDITFRGFAKTIIHGTLYQNLKTKKPKVIIYLHDYNDCTELPASSLNPSFAYFFLRIRGHNLTVAPKNIEPETTKATETSEIKTPGFVIENILDPDTYYIKAIYLDAYRAIDALRLMPELDCSSIGIIGKGLGAACAMFCGCMHERVSAIVMETPLLANIQLSQNKSTSLLTNEINTFYVSSTKSNRIQIKNNLALFDILNFTDKIKIPVLVTVGLKDTISPPGCTMGFFNRLLTDDKTIEVYPAEGNTAGGSKQTLKSIKWLKNRL